MDKALLVNAGLDTGKRILDALDAADVKVSVALWALLSEYQDRRLILASRQLDAIGVREAYGMVYEALERAGFTVEETESLMILGMKEPFIRDLRRAFAPAKSVEGMRLGGQLFGDRFVEEAYVYRIV
jgi:hypothetical protein